MNATGAGTHRLRRAYDSVSSVGLAAAVLAGCLGAGYLLASLAVILSGAPMITWLAGRALGLAAYAALTALTAVGVWSRHPWRFRWPGLHPEVRLRVHAALGAASVALVVGHICVLCLDRYAGVGWVGAVVPGAARYRTGPVALGVLAFEAMLLVTATAALAGRLAGWRWLTVHRLALPLWAVAWLHGVLAGSDSAALRPLYAVTGLVIAALGTSRYVAATVTNRAVAASRW